MCGNYDGLDIHTQAIKQVVALRGGVECLGNFCLLKPISKLETLIVYKGFDGYLKTIVIA